MNFKANDFSKIPDSIELELQRISYIFSTGKKHHLDSLSNSFQGLALIFNELSSDDKKFSEAESKYREIVEKIGSSVDDETAEEENILQLVKTLNNKIVEDINSLEITLEKRPSNSEPNSEKLYTDDLEEISKIQFYLIQETALIEAYVKASKNIGKTQSSLLDDIYGK